MSILDIFKSVGQGSALTSDETPIARSRGIDPVTGSREIERTMWYCRDLGSHGDPDYEREEHRIQTDDPDSCNLVGSTIFQDDSRGDAMHAPVFDFDFPCTLVPTSTEGHFHLYLDREVSWSEYEAILVAFMDAGLLEEGYVKAAQRRRETFHRPPWVKKP